MGQSGHSSRISAPPNERACFPIPPIVPSSLALAVPLPLLSGFTSGDPGVPDETDYDKIAAFVERAVSKDVKLLPEEVVTRVG